MTILNLRSELPWLDKCIYLNYGRTSPVLQSSIQYMQQLVGQANEPLHYHAKEWLAILEKARSLVADLIGADSQEITFVSGTSSGLSLIANSIYWKEGDRVLFPADEFPSNKLVWQNLKKKGVEAVGIPPIKGISFSQQLRSLNLKGVRLVACSAVSYHDGRQHDIDEIVKLCHSLGIYVAVDAIQAVGVVDVDVRRWQCDFLATGGQKWLFGPIGTGFLYIKKEIIDELFVSQIGWASVENYHELNSAEIPFAKGSRRFEPGYLDLPAIGALAHSIEVLKRIGLKSIYQKIEELTDVAQLELSQYSITPKQKAGIITLKLNNAEEVMQKLTLENIIVTQRSDYIRLSMHASVWDHELETFLNVFLKNAR